MGWKGGKGGPGKGVVRTEVGFEDLGVGAAAVEAEEAHCYFPVAAMMVNNSSLGGLKP